VHGFDLTFAAPKSVSLLRALSGDVSEKAVLAAHQRGIQAAMTYLHEHAATPVHNPVTGNKDLKRLPGLVGSPTSTRRRGAGSAPAHPRPDTESAGRADGRLVSIDSTSLYHEARAAGIVYQAVMRHELHAEVGRSGLSMSALGW